VTDPNETVETILHRSPSLAQDLRGFCPGYRHHFRVREGLILKRRRGETFKERRFETAVWKAGGFKPPLLDAHLAG
jgi:hypothetical protein